VPEDEHEFLFTVTDFSRVRRMLHEHAGIALAESKQSMVYNRLSRRLRACGLTRFDRYLELVATDPAEWEACINALTTNLTSFFRESHHFEILADYVKRRHLPRLRIWCTAASTGEEPYSIAMTMIEAYNSDRPPVEIVASDIDTDVLAQAQRGVYALEKLATVSERRRARFFQRGDGPNTGFARVRAPLRALIDFRPINLQDSAWHMASGLDVIMCRNVLIYFEQSTQNMIVHRFRALIADDGLLIMGHSENIGYAGDLFTSIGKTVYRPRTGSRSIVARE
jgi:chemotaxis protein methyltransferase CheR